ncbi:MAG: hypothetical protein M0020_04700 [Actinomycetota bacterium]|nr:hypothetical protein [Actinomycetota bacterium]
MSSEKRPGTMTTSGSWSGRPAGVPGAVPPPSVPLSFLMAASVGLIACGVAWAWVRRAAAANPNSDPAIAAVHFGVLAALTMGILGATHQFATVITGRPLRSVLLARATFVAWLAASWLLPIGIGFEQTAVTAASGGFALLGLLLLAWNLAAPLSVRGKGAPVTALRLALLGAAATTLLGATFVGDRQGNWFVLSAHADLAMGVLGLFAWLGVTYIGVAQKLWPMFMLAHMAGRHRAGTVAVWATWLGAAVLAGGLAHGTLVAEWAGAGALGIGLGAHLVSLWAHLRHRRRKADLHVLFVVTAAAWLVVAAGLALPGALLLPHHYRTGVALVAAAMVACGGWLLEALVGHVHKVEPFIVWSLLRSHGLRSGPSGKPLTFADLYHHGWAAATYGTVTAGIGALCAGLGASWTPAIAAGGALLAATGALVAANLSARPLHLLAAARTGTDLPVPRPPRRRGSTERPT